MVEYSGINVMDLQARLIFKYQELTKKISELF
jgi:hypothetical protein